MPASGKTTLAKAWVAENPAGRARVNRDDLRAMLHDGVYLGQDTERHVAAARNRLIRQLLEAGISVASDDTNLPAQVVRDLARIAADSGASVDVRDLTDVTPEECIDRDVARALDGERAVGELVIRRMFDRYLKGHVSPLPVPSAALAAPVPPRLYVPKPGTPRAVMVDLDGTLCLHNGRSPYDESRVGEDLPNDPVRQTVWAMAEAGFALVFCSGRSEDCREQTEAWLECHVGCHAPLYMRASGDKRKDAIVKREMFDAHIRDRYDVAFVLDDRARVVDEWRAMGLTVFQVAPGQF